MIIWQLILRNEIHETYLYVNACSKPIVYSGMFKTIVIFSQFQGRCSSFTQEQFMHIQNLFLADSGIFRALDYLRTKCFTYIDGH